MKMIVLLSSYNGEKGFLEEMELQKDIECAIRERGLREMLIKEEMHICSQKRKKELLIKSFAGGGLFSMLAAVIFLVLLNRPIAQMMQECSVSYVRQIEVGTLRGGNEYVEQLNRALQLMQNEKWTEASSIIDDVFEQTAIMQTEEISEIHDNAEWLKAICLMHEGKVVRAKRLLQKIVKEENHYSVKAAEMLEKFK